MHVRRTITGKPLWEPSVQNDSWFVFINVQDIFLAAGDQKSSLKHASYYELLL